MFRLTKKKEPLDYRDAIHYRPMEENHNVRCLNGSAHIHRSTDIKVVTCELCKNPLTNKEYWHEKQYEKLNASIVKWNNLLTK